MKIFGVIIIILIVAGIVAFVYFNNEAEEKKELVNLSISAEYDYKKIVTQLEITSPEGSFLLNTSQYYEMFQIPKGEITIKNKNLKDQIYYENIYTYNITEDKTRIDIPLDKPILPEIRVTHINPLNVLLKSSNFKEASYCLSSSVNYLFVSSNETEITKPEKYANYDSCYGTFDLGERIIEITYTPLSNPTNDDFLNISVFDQAGNSLTKRIV